MPDRRILESLKSAERRIAFAVSQQSGVISTELKEALAELRNAIGLLSPERKPVPADGVTILFVDDEEIIRRIGLKILSMAGYKVLLASDGNEALAVYEKNRHLIKCVILDLVMPGMDGIQACANLRDLSPDLGIVMTTGYGEEEIRRRFGELNLQGFLRKPFAAESLVEMVQKAIQKSRCN